MGCIQFEGIPLVAKDEAKLVEAKVQNEESGEVFSTSAPNDDS